MRVWAFIDGFNMWHALCDVKKRGQRQRPPVNLEHLKWLDLRALANRLVMGPERLQRVLYFSAYAKHRAQSYARHELYTGALKLHGVGPIMGRFKQKDVRCHGACGGLYKTHEEKETDVNIAIHMLYGAVMDQYDVGLLFTADSDLVPAVQMVREKAPLVQIRMVTPPGRIESVALKAVAGSGVSHTLSQAQLAASRLPDSLTDGAGAFACPPKFLR